jgi:hypothetical protein
MVLLVPVTAEVNLSATRTPLEHHSNTTWTDDYSTQVLRLWLSQGSLQQRQRTEFV